MDLQLEGRCVLVEGASSGIGFAIAEAFAKQGAMVAIASSHEERIHQASKAIPGSHPFVCDFSVPKAGQALVWQVIEKLGKLDILVTNTGNPLKAPFSDLRSEDWQEGFQQVFMSASDSVAEALHVMKKQEFGRIIMCLSTAAKEPSENLTISSALRAGLLGLMKILSREVAPHGVTVNAILPGFIHTHKLIERFKADLSQIEASIPMKKLGNPEELASLALYLASNQASYITGQAICFDGGLTRGF